MTDNQSSVRWQQNSLCLKLRYFCMSLIMQYTKVTMKHGSTYYDAAKLCTIIQWSHLYIRMKVHKLMRGTNHKGRDCKHKDICMDRYSWRHGETNTYSRWLHISRYIDMMDKYDINYIHHIFLCKKYILLLITWILQLCPSDGNAYKDKHFSPRSEHRVSFWHIPLLWCARSWLILVPVGMAKMKLEKSPDSCLH